MDREERKRIEDEQRQEEEEEEAKREKVPTKLLADMLDPKEKVAM